MFTASFRTVRCRRRRHRISVLELSEFKNTDLESLQHVVFLPMSQCYLSHGARLPINQPCSSYMPHKATVTGVWYADLLHKLHVAIKQNWWGKLTKVPLVLYDNASAHRSHAGQAAALECGFKEMCHPPYSLYLAKWLPSVSKLKETSPWSEIFERWGAQVCERQVVNRTVRTVLFYWHLETQILT